MEASATATDGCDMAAAEVWGYLRCEQSALPLLAGKSCRIGRKLDSDLVLQPRQEYECECMAVLARQSRSVSGEHAVLEVDSTGRQAVLRDLGSLNGCFINNNRLRDQREILANGDNIRFGFDPRVWCVDSAAAKSRPRTSAGTLDPAQQVTGCSNAPWTHARGGAALTEPLERRSVSEPPQLHSGGAPRADFFSQGGDRACYAAPPAHELRTSESGVDGIGGLVSCDPVGAAPSPSAAGESSEPIASRSAVGRETEELGAGVRRLREEGAAGNSVVDSGAESEADAAEMKSATRSFRPGPPGVAAAMTEPLGGNGARGGTVADEEGRVAELLGSALRSATQLHRRLKGNGMGEEAAGGCRDSVGSPRHADSAPSGTSSTLPLATRLATLLQQCEELTPGLKSDFSAKLSLSMQKASAGRMAGLEQLAVRQQQQLLCLRTQLARSQQRVLALSGRENGKTLLLSEAEAAAAQQTVRRLEDEVRELQSSLGKLRYTLLSMRETDKVVGASGATSAGGAALPTELQQFVIERARETASLREKLQLLQHATQQSARRWDQLQADRDSLADRVSELELHVKSSAGAFATALDEASARARGAEEKSARLTAQLASLASEGANGARAKAAEFVVHQLRESQDKLQRLQRDEAHRIQSDARGHMAPPPKRSIPTPREDPAAVSGVHIFQAHDELLELRAQGTAEKVAELQKVLHTLFKELSMERSHVADLEAALALGSDNENASDTLLEQSPSDEVLKSLLYGKELQLRQMEQQMRLLSSTDLLDRAQGTAEQAPRPAESAARGQSTPLGPAGNLEGLAADPNEVLSTSERRSTPPFDTSAILPASTNPDRRTADSVGHSDSSPSRVPSLDNASPKSSSSPSDHARRAAAPAETLDVDASEKSPQTPQGVDYEGTPQSENDGTRAPATTAAASDSGCLDVDASEASPQTPQGVDHEGTSQSENDGTRAVATTAAASGVGFPCQADGEPGLCIEGADVEKAQAASDAATISPAKPDPSHDLDHISDGDDQ